MNLNYEIKIFNTENNITKLQLKLEGKSAWLYQEQTERLFDKNYAFFLKNLFEKQYYFICNLLQIM